MRIRAGGHGAPSSILAPGRGEGPRESTLDTTAAGVAPRNAKGDQGQALGRPDPGQRASQPPHKRVREGSQQPLPYVGSAAREVLPGLLPDVPVD